MIVSTIAAICDLYFNKIPNWLTFPAAVVAVVYHTALSGWGGFLFSLEGIILGTALLVPYYLLGGMGAGDVKLMGAAGGFLGPHGVLMAFLFTALTGGLYAFILLARHGSLKKSAIRFKTMLTTFLLTKNLVYIPPPEIKQKPRLLYGLVIAVGTLLAMGLGNRVS